MDREQRLSAVIELIYDAALEPSRWTSQMQMAASLFDALHGTLQMLDPQCPANDVVRTLGFDPAIEAEYLLRRIDEDFLLEGAQRNAGRIVTGTELISIEEMRKRAFYHDIVRPLDVEYMLGCVVQTQRGMSVGWSFLRPRRRENFGVAEKRLMQTLTPHLRRAMLMRGTFAELSRRTTALESVLNRSDSAIFLIDARGCVRFANTRAQELVDRDDGLTIVGNRIRLWLPSAQECLRREIGLCGGTGRQIQIGSTPIAMSAKRSGGTLQCVVFPISRNVDTPLADTQATCALIVYEPGRSRQMHPEWVARLYGLTPAESRVAAEIAGGRAPRDIAARRGVSVNTVRTHLKSLFRKCGVRTQSKLVRLLNSGADVDSFR